MTFLTTGQPSTCDISGPRRPPGTFDTPNCTVSSVSVGWWCSGTANGKTPVNIFNSDMKPGVFPVPRAAGSLLKNNKPSLEFFMAWCLHIRYIYPWAVVFLLKAWISCSFCDLFQILSPSSVLFGGCGCGCVFVHN